MKKTLIIVMMCFGFVAANAQNSAIRKAERSLEKEEYAEAKNYVDEAVQHEKTRDKSKAWFTKGKVYGTIAQAEDESVRNLDDNPLKEATEAYEKAMELEEKETAPTYVFAQQELENLWGQMINQGATAYEAANYEEAVKYFDRALTVKPQDTTAALYAGVASQQMGNNELAANYFYKLVESGNADESIYSTLIAYESNENEDLDKARELTKKAQEKFPENQEYKKLEVNILLQQDKTAEAKEEIKKAIAAEPDNADLYFNLGYLNEELENDQEAIEAYKQALEVDPAHKNSAFNLAVLHYNKAADLVKEANQLGISAADRKKEQQLLKEANKKFEEAIPHLETALSLHPENRTITEITMVAYDRAGEEEKAQELENKLESMPK